MTEHNHETGGAWSVTRWAVPGCPVCELDAARFEAIGSSGLREDVVPLADAKRILGDRLAAVQAERDEWGRIAEQRLQAQVAAIARAESAEAENARLRSRLGAVEAAVKVMAGEMDAATYLALRAALDSPTSHTQQEAEVGARDAERAAWSSWLDGWLSAVGPVPPTVEQVADALRSGPRPFGAARADALAADTTNPAPNDQETP